jgi:hypothetical protein
MVGRSLSGLAERRPSPLLITLLCRFPAGFPLASCYTLRLSLPSTSALNL